MLIGEGCEIPTGVQGVGDLAGTKVPRRLLRNSRGKRAIRYENGVLKIGPVLSKWFAIDYYNKIVRETLQPFGYTYVRILQKIKSV
jgi:hypothetical protein